MLDNIRKRAEHEFNKTHGFSICSYVPLLEDSTSMEVLRSFKISLLECIGKDTKKNYVHWQTQKNVKELYRVNDAYWLGGRLGCKMLVN